MCVKLENQLEKDASQQNNIIIIIVPLSTFN